MALLEWLLSAVPGIELGTPIAKLGKTLGAKPSVRSTGWVDYDLADLDGATRTVTIVPTDEERAKGVDAIVMFAGTKKAPSKPVLAAFKKEVTAALTAKHGAPDLKKQKNCPHWSLGNRQFVQMTTWSSTDDMGLEKHYLKLSSVRA